MSFQESKIISGIKASNPRSYGLSLVMKFDLSTPVDDVVAGVPPLVEKGITVMRSYKSMSLKSAKGMVKGT